MGILKNKKRHLLQIAYAVKDNVYRTLSLDQKVVPVHQTIMKV